MQPLIKRMLAKEDLPVIIQADKASTSGLLVRILDEVKLAAPTAKVSLASVLPRG